MTSSRLAELGIRLAAEDVQPELRSQCLRLAHRLHASGAARVGLFPSGERVSAVGVALQIADALADATAAAVAVVDANGAWPAFPAPEGEGEFGLQWLRGSLALVSPRAKLSAGQVVPRLAAWLAAEQATFAHVVLDLTGFDRLGEHRAAAQLLDVCFVVARAGVTSETELARWRRELPDDKLGGVVLVSGR